jgi:uncharacterized surface protein with fasciclin (FAS1) repeats
MTQIRLRTLAVAVIGAVLLAALTATAGATRPASTQPAAMRPSMNIVQAAVAAGQFKTLVKLVKAAGLAGTLSTKGPFTVFAPTDAAFAKVPKKTLNALLKNKAQLRQVLLYHVVAGKVTAAKVVKLKSAPTLAKKSLAISVMGGAVYLNGSTKVIQADVPATNGVIHVVNKVLIPPAS